MNEKNAISMPNDLNRKQLANLKEFIAVNALKLAKILQCKPDDLKLEFTKTFENGTYDQMTFPWFTDEQIRHGGTRYIAMVSGIYNYIKTGGEPKTHLTVSDLLRTLCITDGDQFYLLTNDYRKGERILAGK